jgi:hypothetical protein
MKFNLYITVVILLLIGCNIKSDSVKENIAAKIDDDELPEQQLMEWVFNASGKDSTYLKKRAIKEWATEVLFYREALSKLEKDEIQIERQVEEYRKSLVNHIYRTRIIEANLDTVVSKVEIEEYYAANRDNFILKDNIVKVNYFKIPLKVPVLDKMKRLFYAVQPKDKEQLKSMSIQYAENFFMNDSTWLYLDDIKKEIPNLRDRAELIVSAGKVFEFTDEFYYYFLRIIDMKVKNSLSPVNFERQNIKNLIVNKRKNELIRDYKKQLLDKAVEEKKLLIY